MDRREVMRMYTRLVERAAPMTILHPQQQMPTRAFSHVYGKSAVHEAKTSLCPYAPTGTYDSVAAGRARASIGSSMVHGQR